MPAAADSVDSTSDALNGSLTLEHIGRLPARSGHRHSVPNTNRPNALSVCYSSGPCRFSREFRSPWKLRLQARNVAPIRSYAPHTTPSYGDSDQVIKHFGLSIS